MEKPPMEPKILEPAHKTMYHSDKTWFFFPATSQQHPAHSDLYTKQKMISVDL